jgi:hypothetical protein
VALGHNGEVVAGLGNASVQHNACKAVPCKRSFLEGVVLHYNQSFTPLRL